ncbi:MAG: Ycf66 family protein [Elainellaceae cyanobacterium]
MINIGGGPAFILGVAMVLAGVALYALRSMRPELSRDHDIFFAAIALTTGAILMWQGWRLDPFLFLGYLCAAGSATFFGVENIRLRGITTEQAKRSTPITDKGRSVSRRYDYEPQDYDQDYDYRPERGLPSREERAGRRIRATRDARQDYPEGSRRLRRDEYDERYDRAPYEDDGYAQVDDAPPVDRAPRKRRLPRSGRSAERAGVRDDVIQDSWDAPTAAISGGQRDERRPTPAGYRPDSPSKGFDDAPARPPSRPSQGSSRRRPLNVKPAPAGYGEPYGDEPPAASADYADYRPVDDSAADDEADNSDYQQLY